MNVGCFLRAKASRVLVAVCLASPAGAQIPASFEAPLLGYVFDADVRAIRPVLGIPGNSIVGPPLELGFAITEAAILPTQKHAIVSSHESGEVKLIDLSGGAAPVSIAGAASPPTVIRASAEGGAAALYYATLKRVVIVTGLRGHPAIHSTIDVSFNDRPVKKLAVSDDGSLALLAFSGDLTDSLYSWMRERGPRFVVTATSIADITFVGGDAVMADAGSAQIVWIRNVQDQAVPVLVADSSDGLVQPIALSVAARSEIYVGDAGTGTVMALDAVGHVVRRVRCGCTLTGLFPLRDFRFRLTDRLDRPIYMIDRADPIERILFIPALAEPAP